MATNENQIGVKAIFAIDDFKVNQQLYDALLKNANTATATFYNNQAAQQKKATQAAQASATAQQSALKNMVNQYTATAGALAVIFGGMVVSYKNLRDAATKLGDTESIAGFDAMEEATTNLADSFSAMVLEGARVGDILEFMASGVTALLQVLILVGGAVTWFGHLYVGTFELIQKRIEEMKQGKIFTSEIDIGAELAAINARANQAANEVIIAGATAPARVKETAGQKDRDKQLEKDKEAFEKRKQQVADYANKIRDLQIKSGEDILAAEADLHEKQANAWSDYMSKSADIIGEGIKKRAELLTTYQDALRGAESEYQRATENAAYNHGQKLADIERTYQETVRNIQRDYQEDSLDAARNLDAVGFVRAKQRRDRGLDDAARARDIANSSENENYQRQLSELQRNLEDKKREAEQAYRRGLDDQRRAEQEAQQSAKDSYNKQRGDAQNAFNARLGAIQTAYNNEDAAAQAHYLNQETLLQQHLARMQALMATYGIGGRPATAPRRVGGEQMAEGGARVVSSPTQFTAGEAGPELAMFVPLNRAVPVAAAPQVINHTGDFTHRIDSTIRSSVAGIDGRITAAVTKVLREVLG